MANVLKIDGAAIAQKIIDGLKTRPRPEKLLAVVLIGNDKASFTFTRCKSAVARELGVAFELFQFSVTDYAEDAVEERIRSFSRDERIGGIVLQLPLPERFDRDTLIATIDVCKDVDNLTGKAEVEVPAVGVVKEIMHSAQRTAHHFGIIAVVGKGFLVGAPIVRWFRNECKAHSAKCKIKVADIETVHLREFVADADLVITGVGKAGLIDPAWLKAGAGIIDFGFPADFNTSNTIQNSKLLFYTPTPGGTGPILVAKLFENFYTLNN